MTWTGRGLCDSFFEKMSMRGQIARLGIDTATDCASVVLVLYIDTKALIYDYSAGKYIKAVCTGRKRPIKTRSEATSLLLPHFGTIIKQKLDS